MQSSLWTNLKNLNAIEKQGIKDLKIYNRKQIKKAYEHRTQIIFFLPSTYTNKVQKYIIWETKKKSDDTGTARIIQEDSGLSQAGLLTRGLTCS
jgi:hypothetical protein